MRPPPRAERPPAGPNPVTRPLIALLVVLAAGTLVLGVLAYHSVRVSAAGPAAETFAYRKLTTDAGLPELWQAPSFAFNDQHGKVTKLGDLAGRPFVADFIYTTCTSACPLITARMVAVQRRLTQPALRFVSFSVDPEHDTEQALASYQEKWNPAETRWLLLRTDEKGLAEITQGMRVARETSDDPQNPIVHSSMFFLVDGRGSVRGVYDSSDARALDRLADDASSLLGGAGTPRRPGDATGEALYASLRCAACHDDPKVAPAVAGLAGRAVSFEGGGSATADAAYVRESITAPGVKLVRGYLNLMPSFSEELSKDELERLVAYVLSQRAPEPVAKAPEAKAAAATGRSTASVPAGAAASAPASAAPPASELPSIATDPVCGMSVRVATDTPKAEHAGKHFYFCSESCRERFEKEPEKFASKSAAPAGMK